MAIALVAHTTAQTTNYNNPVTTTAIDTTGATLIVIFMGWDTSSTFVPSDSKSNTWTGLTAHNPSFPQRAQMFYCANPTVGSGHTFTAPALGARILVAAFSGTRTSSTPFDTQNGAQTSSSVTTLQTGSITPSGTGDLIITGVAANVAATLSIDSSFTIIDQGNFSAGVGYGGGLAWLLAPSTSAVNPTWTATASQTSGMGTTVATFRLPAASGNLFRAANLSLGSGGPFFSNPLG